MTVTKRDLSKQQFLNALDREGFGRPEFAGYCNLGIEGHGIFASYANASSDRWRDRLTYLRRERAKQKARLAAKENA